MSFDDDSLDAAAVAQPIAQPAGDVRPDVVRHGEKRIARQRRHILEITPKLISRPVHAAHLDNDLVTRGEIRDIVFLQIDAPLIDGHLPV